MAQDLHAIGVEYKELKFDGFWDWFIHIDNLEHHWKHEPTYVIAQFAFIFGGIATLLHAIFLKKRLPYLWLGILIHGVVTECMCFAMPDIDNYWHSQTPIIFLGRRLPLHIMFLYPCFLYNASIAVAKLKLPRWSEPFAVGLAVVMIDIPYDITSVNFLHWTWHDTDPNIGDRHYWVPWNSYYFHSCFAASFTFWFHQTRKWICKNSDKWEADCWVRELICTVIAGVLGVPGGILMFLPLYHPLHDIYKIHSEVTYFILFSMFMLLIWSGVLTSRRNSEEKEDAKPSTSKSTFLLVAHLILHYSSFWIMTVFFNPEDEVAIGLKEPIGPCDEHVPIHTAFGMTLQKRKYLCATDYDEKYFDWHCLPDGKPPGFGASWYTACGVPFPNRAEYIAIITTICILGAGVFYNLHFRSKGDVFNVKQKLNRNKNPINVQRKKNV